MSGLNQLGESPEIIGCILSLLLLLNVIAAAICGHPTHFRTVSGPLHHIDCSITRGKPSNYTSPRRAFTPLHFYFFFIYSFFSDECTIHNLDPNASKAAHIET